jgi:hypothetical protein
MGSFLEAAISLWANDLFQGRTGVDPGEIVSDAGRAISRFHIRRQRTRMRRHCLINLGLEIGRLFDQDRRKVRVVG